MIGIINLANGSNYVDFDISGTNVAVTLNDDEKVNFENSIVELTTLDVSNKEWLIESTLLSQAQDFTLNSTGITEAVTLYDKGGYVDEYSAAYTPLITLINSILSRKINADNGNIIGFIIIKRLNSNDYLIQVRINDILNAVESIDIIFVDFTSATPIPTEINLNSPVIDGNIKTFSMNTLTFEDSNVVVGETYNIVIDFKDFENKSIDYIEISVIIQNI
jgi:hypothetical protein